MVGADVDGRAVGVLDGEAVVGGRVDGFCVGIDVVGDELGNFVRLSVVG